MAPKGRKSLSLWYECESCHVVLQSKDTETHGLTSCPPNVEEWTQSFIKDKALYSYVEEGKLQDVAGNLSDSDREELVLLSQSVLQLCGMVIGEPVTVTIEGHTEVKLAWPTTERTLTSVLLSAPALEHGWESAQGRVIVMKLKSVPMPAKEISLKFEAGLDAQSVDRVCLLNLISHRYQGKIVRVGSRISIPFYGRHMRLRVKSVEPFEAAPAGHLEEALQCLSLDVTSLEFYKAIGSTNWMFDPYNIRVDRKEEPCKVTLANVGGYLNVINELKETISYSLGCKPAIPGVPASFGVLLYGVHGTGKSLLAQALANESQANVFNIQSGDLFSKYYGETESRLRQIFCEAKRSAPSVLILDDVETICPKRGTDQERRVVAALLSLLDSLCEQRMVVLATTSLPQVLDPGLRRPGRLDREVELTVPSADDRIDILNKLLADSELAGSPVLMEVGRAAHGFVGADLAAIVARANAAAAFAMCRTLVPEHLLAALCQVKPSAMREVLIQVPNVHWEDIGGQEDLKLKLRQAVEWPLHHPEAFLRLGITPPRGLLMFGPPGCSKTMIAKALATESKLNFLSIKGGELFSKWVGESERAVSELFRRARSVAPAIVFLDEVDAVSGVRGGSGEGGSSVQERVLAQLLTELDGVQPLTGVTVVAATNRPDRIDKALLRPGRLDRLIYVPLPDKATRRQILQIQLRKMPVTEEVVIEELAASTENYSGAEVVAVCHEAALKALEKDLSAEVVSGNDFHEALRIVTPRTPLDLLQLYKKYCS